MEHNPEPEPEAALLTAQLLKQECASNAHLELLVKHDARQQRRARAVEALRDDLQADFRRAQSLPQIIGEWSIMPAGIGGPPADPPSPLASSALDPPRPPPIARPAPQVPDEQNRPHTAVFERGQWYYLRDHPTPRGVRTRRVPATEFSHADLNSDHFAALRRAATEAVARESDPTEVAALLAEPMFAGGFASRRSATTQAMACAINPPTPFDLTPPAFPAVASLLFPIPEGAEPPSRGDSTPDILASKVWFARVANGAAQLLSYVRRDSGATKPQFDTFGGKMEPCDRSEFHRCALRELKEEAVLPKQWHEAYTLELASFPEGHRLLSIIHSLTGYRHQVALWLVFVPDEYQYLSVRPTAVGLREILPDSLRWRSASEVVSNLATFHSFAPTAAALAALLQTTPILSTDA